MLTRVLKSKRLSTCEDNRKVIMIMTISISDRTAKQQHRAVENWNTVRIGLLQRRHQSCESLDLPTVDLRELFFLVCMIAVMAHLMMTVRDTEFWE